MKELKFRKLTADEIDCRVGTISDKGFSLLLYKDARCDQRILDETVGAFNWQRDHKEVKGNMFCGVGIHILDLDEGFQSQWVWKWDCGVESNTEKEKGEASDSFKRACFNWGIGRELYTAPFIWVNGNTTKNAKGNFVPTYKSIKVVRLEYNEDHISALTISGDGEVIFEWGTKKQQHAEPKVEQPKKAQPTADNSTLSLEEAQAFTTKSGKRFSDLTIEQLEYIIDHTSSDRTAMAAHLVLDSKQLVGDLEELPNVGEGDLPF